MCRNSIITLLIIILIHERRAFALLMNESVCFIRQFNNKNDTWCVTELKLCGNAPAYDMSVIIKQFESAGDNKCDKQCINQSTVSQVNHTSEVLITCNGKSNCSLAYISVPSTQHGGILTVMFVCNNTDDGVEEDNSTTKNTGNTLLPTSSSVTRTSIPTTDNSTRTTESSIFSTGNNTITTGTAQFSTDSGDSYTVVIVVSVVVPIVIVVVVVAILMYRRGQCQLLLGKCTKRYAKHSPDRTDTHIMSSTANSNLYCDLNRDIDGKGSDVDYCEIDKVTK